MSRINREFIDEWYDEDDLESIERQAEEDWREGRSNPYRRGSLEALWYEKTQVHLWWQGVQKHV